MVLARTGGSSKQGRLLWAGSPEDAPYGELVAAIPKAMFRELERGASVFRARVREVSWRQTDARRQRLGFPDRVTVLEVEVLDVVQSDHGLAPTVRARLDLMPRPPLAPPTMKGLFRHLPAREVDPERTEPGAITWFAADRVWGKLAVLRAES